MFFVLAGVSLSISPISSDSLRKQKQESIQTTYFLFYFEKK